MYCVWGSENKINSRAAPHHPLPVPGLPLPALLHAHAHPPLHLHQLLAQPPSTLLHPAQEQGSTTVRKSKKKWIRICGDRLHLIETHLDSEAPGCCQSPHRLMPKVLTINWRNPGSVMSCTYKITRALPNFVGTHKVASSIKVFLEYTTSVKCPILLHFLHSLSKDLHFS